MNIFWGLFNFTNMNSEWMIDIDYFHLSCIVFMLPILMIILMFIYFYLNKEFFFYSKINSNPTLEMAWTIFPIQLLFIIAFPSLQLLSYTEFLTFFPESFNFNMTGNQWFWEGSYLLNKENGESCYKVLDKDLEKGDFREISSDVKFLFPMGEVIKVFVSSNDVIHSFFVPDVGVKADAMAGKISEVSFFPLSESESQGICAENCGANHSHMPFIISFTKF